MRGAVRLFIEATTPYKVCDAVDNDVSAIHKATENRCDVVLLHLTTPLQDTLVTLSLLRSKLPMSKSSASALYRSLTYKSRYLQKAGFDAVIAQEDGLSKLVETLKTLMPEPPRE